VNKLFLHTNIISKFQLNLTISNYRIKITDTHKAEINPCGSGTGYNIPSRR